MTRPEFRHVERGLDTVRWYERQDGYDRWDEHRAQLHILWLGPRRAFLAGLHGDRMTRQRRIDIMRYLVGQGAQWAYSIRKGRWVTYTLQADGSILRTSEPYESDVPPSAMRGKV